MGSKSGPGGNAFQEIEQRQIDEIAEKVAAVAQTASDQIEIGKQKVGSALAAANERGKTAGRNVAEVGGNFKAALDKSLDEQPTATLIMAAAFGFLVGALWRSR